MSYEDLRWPCPECREEDQALVHWGDSQPNYLRDASGNVSRAEWSMRWDCDACKKHGRMTYSVN